MRVFCDLPGVNEEVYVGVVLPSYASFLGVPVVDVVVLLSPGDGGAAGADALDGLKNKESKGGGLEENVGFNFTFAFPLWRARLAVVKCLSSNVAWEVSCKAMTVCLDLTPSKPMVWKG